MSKWYILTVFVFVHNSSHCTKWHAGSFGFDNPESWLSGYPPCALDVLVFPILYPAVLPLPRTIDISGLVLFVDGALLMGQDAILVFNNKSQKYPCANKHYNAFINPPKVSKWFDPRSWRNSEAIKINNAIPELYRVPCNDESVVITQDKGPLSFDLENVPFLRFGQLSLMGSLISKDYLQKLISTDIGQLLFRNSRGVQVEYFRNENCGCHKDFNKYVETICHNIMDTCERPLCLNPIKPYGSCCPVCGAILRFNLQQCYIQVRKSFASVLKNAIVTQGLSEESDLAIHIDFFSSTGYGNYLQAVIVDRAKYSGKSLWFVKKFSTSANKSDILKIGQKLEILYAGGPYDPSISIVSGFLILFCAIFVGIFGIIIFAHYTPYRRTLNRIPEWTSHLQSRFLRSPYLFAQFDTPGATDNMEPVQPRVLVYNVSSDEVRECEFDNPMFSERTQSMSDSKKKNEIFEATTSTLSLSEAFDEQNLIEINLASFNDSSERGT